MPLWSVRFDLHVAHESRAVLVPLARAHALAAVIRGLPVPPQLADRLDALNIARAVHGTTAIEGTEVTPAEVLQIMASEAAALAPARGRDEREVRNAQAAMQYIAGLLRAQPNQPLSEELIRRLHELLTRGIVYPSSVPGEYRSHAVRAGNYLPPVSGAEVRRLMRDFVAWVNAPPAANWDPIVRALAAHFYLVSIHPFGDGNGRTARAVESFLLYQAGVNARGFYSLANYYYQERVDYVKQLDAARFNSPADLTPFILFGLRGLVSELEAVQAEVLGELRLIAYRDHAREVLLGQGVPTKATERIFRFALSLGHQPVEVAELLGGAHPLYRRIARRTVYRDLEALRDHGLVTLEGGKVTARLEVVG